ncbi:ChaN family lipoprotein [Pedobacter cryoconitis]|uniref:Putative iron-regulated protein n=1 Tax=Pedobacter cryoconitis TaxID=188932 RepID=A0A7X0J6A6_9SPHI|nr:ChaN family lipoprotein [Pedobacter cryoconitis]MBB6501895.1 putative iron-regulated protein [Pedobacter cryoconitis]
MKTNLLILFWVFIPVFLFAQNTDQSYKIFETKTKKTISVAELIKKTKNADVLFFGEEHNDSIGHLLETQIFSGLLQTYPGTALSMEMFSTDVQPIMNEYLAGVISEKNFIKEARAWNNYNDYKPLIELAKQNKANVIAANAATRYSNAVTFSGLNKLNDFPAASKAFLPPLPIDTATGRYYNKFIETLGGHDMGAMKIYQTQNLWDATMAWSIAQYALQNPGKKIFQVNGRFHSDEHLGITNQLRKYAPKLKLLTISCFAAEDISSPDWAKNQAEPGDFIILTSKK